MFYRRPHLPKTCGCGHKEADRCDEIGLGNHRSFPPFAYLPDENDIDDDYYHQVEESSSYSPSRYWVLAGQIVENRTAWIRPRVLLETRFGEQVLVNFHLEDSDTPTFFGWPDLVVGSTMCIMYPNSRTFMDMNQGIRQEYSKSVMIFPASLETLTRECENLHYGKDETANKCFNCGKRKEDGERLKTCARCKSSLYCSRECQVGHWKNGHKKLCGYMSMISSLTQLDFERFEGFLDWSFAPNASQV
jgi:hypothetical protein